MMRARFQGVTHCATVPREADARRFNSTNTSAHDTAWRQDTDSDYGTILTLRDALFGTLRRRPREPIARFGVEGMQPQPLGIASLALLPFRRATGG